MAGMSGVGSFLCISSFFTALSACVIHCVGFGTHFWLEGDGYSPFLRIGLFQACFDECTYPYCPAGDQFVYDGCWKLWDEHFMEVWRWLKPDWFIRMRTLAIILVPLVGVNFFLSLALALIICIWRYPRTKTPCRNYSVQALSISTAAVSLVSTIMLSVVLCTFAFNAKQYGWMPLPDRNSFGYSFWLEVCADILLGYTFLATLLAFIFKTLRISNPADPKVAEDMMLGRNYAGNDKI